jgi:hypothetical protein
LLFSGKIKMDSLFRGLRRRDAEANIRAANGAKREPRMRRVNDEQRRVEKSLPHSSFQ